MMAKDIEKKPKKESKHFFKDFKAELKKVIWPTPKQIVKNTVAVITIVLITAVIVFTLDVIFEALNTYGVNNIRKVVKTDDSITTTDNDNQNENSGEASTSEGEANEGENPEETTVEENQENANTENEVTEENTSEQE